MTSLAAMRRFDTTSARGPSRLRPRQVVATLEQRAEPAGPSLGLTANRAGSPGPVGAIGQSLLESHHRTKADTGRCVHGIDGLQPVDRQFLIAGRQGDIVLHGSEPSA